MAAVVGKNMVATF